MNKIIDNLLNVPIWKFLMPSTSTSIHIHNGDEYMEEEIQSVTGTVGICFVESVAFYFFSKTWSILCIRPKKILKSLIQQKWPILFFQFFWDFFFYSKIPITMIFSFWALKHKKIFNVKNILGFNFKKDKNF